MQVIFRQAPKKTGTSGHYGSRLVFRGDGTLFVTLGERQSYATEAQSLASQLGKVVRIHPTDAFPPTTRSPRRADSPLPCGPMGTAIRRPRRCTRPPASCGSPSTGPRAATK